MHFYPLSNEYIPRYCVRFLLFCIKILEYQIASAKHFRIFILFTIVKKIRAKFKKKISVVCFCNFMRISITHLGNLNRNIQYTWVQHQMQHRMSGPSKYFALNEHDGLQSIVVETSCGKGSASNTLFSRVNTYSPCPSRVCRGEKKTFLFHWSTSDTSHILLPRFHSFLFQLINFLN